jgi:hypothetical protein
VPALLLATALAAPLVVVPQRHVIAQRAALGAAADVPGSLREMLGLAPDVLSAPYDPDWAATYANVAAQLAAVGVSTPSSLDDPAFPRWAAATSTLTLGSIVWYMAGVYRPEWRETFGFDAWQIDQELVLGDWDVTILRGRFDEAELRAAWKQSEYQEIVIAGTTVSYFLGDRRLDGSSPVSRLGLGRMNYAVMLQDGTLVFAGTAAAVSAVLDVEAGRAPALADNADVQTLLHTMQPDLVSAVLMNVTVGKALEIILARWATSGDSTPSPEDLNRTGVLPPVRLAVLGITPGGPMPAPIVGGTPEPVAEGQPRARFTIGLLMADQAAAATAAPVVLKRLTTLTTLADPDLTYAELYPERTVGVVAGTPVVLIDLAFAEDQGPWVVWQALRTFDLLFIM